MRVSTAPLEYSTFWITPTTPLAISKTTLFNKEKNPASKPHPALLNLSKKLNSEVGLTLWNILIRRSYKGL